MGDEEAISTSSRRPVACGATPATKGRCAQPRAAKARGVVVGAHPGFPDRENFGRRRMVLPPEELDATIREQVRTLVELGEAEGWPVRYVKLHGALANMAAEDESGRSALLCGRRGVGPEEPAILAIDNSAQSEVASRWDCTRIREAYADRAYQPDGLLVPRPSPAPFSTMPRPSPRKRAIRLAQQGELVAIDGVLHHRRARSLRIHGDNPEAVAIARW